MFSLPEQSKQNLNDLGLLVLRVATGSMMLIFHGWGKLMSFAEKSAVFPDPLGVSSPISMSLAIGAEVFCALAIILGVTTRLAAIPLVITMLVAVCIIHADDPWSKKEFAMLYLVPFFALTCTGPGRYSIDALLFKKKDGHNGA